MSIILKKVHETVSEIFFELPDVVLYRGKTVGKFKMTSPAGLIRALNANQHSLHELFENKEDFVACWKTARIERKKIVVEKYETPQELQAVLDKIAEIKKAEAAKRECAVCGSVCNKSKKMIGCCSAQCYQIKLAQRNESAKKSHWCKSERYSQIRDKRIETRKKNDALLHRKHTPWNKGKTGIYSPDTLEKIRAATRLQFHRELFKKTVIEKKIEGLLEELCANFKYSFILAGRQYDFVLHDVKAVIETHGDFWHGNPQFWGEGKRQLRDHQIMKRLDDDVKKRIAKDHGYEYFEFWEHDIHNNWASCVERVREILNANRQCDKDNIKD